MILHNKLILLVIFLLFCYIKQFNSFKINNKFNPLLKRSNKLSSRLYTFLDLPAGEFDKEVVHSNVPVIVDFSATWCGPCKLMLPIFKALAEEYSPDEVKLIKVDTDIHDDTVDRFNIQGVPLFGVFINGEMVATHSGAITKDRLREFIEKNAKVKVKSS